MIPSGRSLAFKLMSTPSDFPVAGLWSRKWEEDPLGASEIDRTTLVWWIQTPCGLYVDLRLPQASPGRSLESSDKIQKRPFALASPLSLEAQEHIELPVLLSQKSFAGALQYSAGDTTDGEALRKDEILNTLSKNSSTDIPLCTLFWKRQIDYQPPTGGLDVGVCCTEAAPSTDGSVILRETGDDGSYAEGWYRLPNTHQGPFLAMVYNDVGFWVRAGSFFAYAVGRPDDAIAKCVGKSLAQATELASVDSATSYICVAGRVLDNEVYRIDHALNPELVGCNLASPMNTDDCCSTLHASESLEEGSLVEQRIENQDGEVVTRVWKIVQISGCSLPISS